mmetsp:Transcript_6039/g.9998  ORF Transcript_6039/g.9998 Transcript_6039/m.9998 type:complete len:153 (-) Transcript_6039:333-791(-)
MTSVDVPLHQFHWEQEGCWDCLLKWVGAGSLKKGPPMTDSWSVHKVGISVLDQGQLEEHWRVALAEASMDCLGEKILEPQQESFGQALINNPYLLVGGEALTWRPCQANVKSWSQGGPYPYHWPTQQHQLGHCHGDDALEPASPSTNEILSH